MRTVPIASYCIKFVEPLFDYGIVVLSVKVRKNLKKRSNLPTIKPLLVLVEEDGDR